VKKQGSEVKNRLKRFLRRGGKIQIGFGITSLLSPSLPSVQLLSLVIRVTIVNIMIIMVVTSTITMLIMTIGH